jgi:hypothetical protein
MPEPKKLIEEMWQAYLLALGPSCCQLHEREKRDVFFAGAAAMMHLSTLTVDEATNPVERYQALKDEIRAHTTDLAMRLESPSGRIH